MPKLDRMGPESKGPKTGQALGKCNSDEKKKEQSGRFGGIFSQRRRRHKRFWNFSSAGENKE